MNPPREPLDWQRPSDDQRRYVDALVARFRLTAPQLDRFCETHYGYAYGEISKRECSALIDTLKAWVSVPPDLQRMAGQKDLFAL